MTDSAKQAGELDQEDDQNLWRAMYTAAADGGGGWSEGVMFANHRSIAAPALAEVNGSLYCAHRGGGLVKQLPLRWTSFDPATVLPFAAALEKARAALPEGATEQQGQERQAAIEAATEALEAADKWARDADVSSFQSCETPALVNDNGTLRMVFTHAVLGRSSARDGSLAVHETALYETSLDTSGDRPRWKPARQVPTDGALPVAPGLAVFNGAVHLVYVDLFTSRVRHLARDAEGAWAPVPAVGDDGKATAPKLSYYVGRNGAEQYALKVFNAHGWPGSLTLAVHDSQLHLLFRGDPLGDLGEKRDDDTYPGGQLWHAVFDGSTWSSTRKAGPKEPGGRDTSSWYGSRRGAALASYDGKLHAVFPSHLDDKLHHGTWTAEAGWSEPVALEGHDSRNSPALLALKEGPEGDEREALLLVHRGVDRYVPPTPPIPPTLDDVATRGTPVIGKLQRAYGARDWSRLDHRFILMPATLNNGKPGLIVAFEAWAQYRWGLGWSWYRENYGGMHTPHLSGTLTLWKKDGIAGSAVGTPVFLSNNNFSNGYYRQETLYTDLKPGTYEASLDTGTKTGGYWYFSDAPLQDTTVEWDYEQYTRITDFYSSSATITITG
ncbi:hypothetical protein ACFXKR_37140 [Streptomyces violascens]|uniref:hypothetical protein n=1 Tax=Streptomyces violascens TaxID=67381 RepID=UPI0036742FA1